MIVSDSTDRRVATELFLIAAGRELVKTAARALAARRIPVMPLKGVLLQRLVYGEKSFRPITDVDLLVPERRFFEACAQLRAAGFTDERWEHGEWQVTLKNPSGIPLGIDLHRRLTRTERGGLTATGMFARGASDTQLFDAAVIVPRDDDLLAHLLLHATLEWLNLGTLHRPEDFEALATARGMDAIQCARHLSEQKLLAHASLMLPLIGAKTGGSFARDLMRHLQPDTRARAVATLVHGFARRFAPATPARRVAALALAPSIARALLDAVRDRASPKATGRVWAPVAKPRRDDR